MFCPECGLDAHDAKFCPECGTDLKAIRGVLGVEESSRERRAAGRATLHGRRPHDRRLPSPHRNGGRGAVPPAGPAGARRSAGARPRSPGGASRLSPLLIWAVAGVIMVVIVAAIMIIGRSPSGATAAGGATGQPTGPVAADTSGAYRELVARANGLYDQGAQAFQSKNTSGAAQYFAAAATVYEAAWAKQPGDPNVGTDLATSLYYSGDTAAALKQVDAVLAKTPDFQTAG